MMMNERMNSSRPTNIEKNSCPDGTIWAVKGMRSMGNSNRAFQEEDKYLIIGKVKWVQNGFLVWRHHHTLNTHWCKQFLIPFARREVTRGNTRFLESFLFTFPFHLSFLTKAAFLHVLYPCASTLPSFHHANLFNFCVHPIHLFLSTSLIWRVFLSLSIWHSILNSSWLLESNQLLSKSFPNGKSTHGQDGFSRIRSTILLTLAIRIIYSDRCKLQ